MAAGNWGRVLAPSCCKCTVQVFGKFRTNRCLHSSVIQRSFSVRVTPLRSNGPDAIQSLFSVQSLLKAQRNSRLHPCLDVAQSLQDKTMHSSRGFYVKLSLLSFHFQKIIKKLSNHPTSTSKIDNILTRTTWTQLVRAQTQNGVSEFYQYQID